MCWTRQLTGDFSQIVQKVALSENMTALDPEALCELELSEQGELARDILLNDLQML
jgi:hypothetical protein